jgi:hypothetical protein
MNSEVPYRGEVDGGEKKHRRPSPPNPYEKINGRAFLFILSVIGVWIGFFAFTTLTFLGIYGFFVYVMIVVVVFVAMQDAKDIKKIAPEPKDEKVLDASDGPSRAEDYFPQITSWLHAQRRRHQPSHGDAPGQAWRYQRLAARNRQTAQSCFMTLIIYAAVVLLFAVAGLVSKVFGANPSITAETLIILGFAGIGAYLIRQN